MTGVVCVFTGDLVGSTRASESAIEQAMCVLSDAAERFEKWSPQLGSARFTRFRGDGWHLVVHFPTRAFRAAMFLCAHLRAADTGLSTRISIGIGAAKTLGTESLADARGAAFQISGTGLDKMKRGHTVTVEGEGVTPLHMAVVLLAAERSGRWTKEQAEAVALMLTNDAMNQSHAAEQLGISPQAMSSRLTGAGFQALEEAILLWEREPLGQLRRNAAP